MTICGRIKVGRGKLASVGHVKIVSVFSACVSLSLFLSP